MRSSHWIALAVVFVVLASGLWILFGPRGRGTGPGGGATATKEKAGTAEEGGAGPASGKASGTTAAPGKAAATAAPTAFPNVKRWLTRNTYIDNSNRMFSRYDADGDGLYDADEMLMYGTLRYDNRTMSGVPRIDQPPDPGPDPDDTDGDGLPDAWEMGYFGTLKYGPWDDPDDDGFPNLIEYNFGQSPIKADLLDPNVKPKKLIDAPPPPKLGQGYRWSADTKEFWAAQERAAARVKAGEKAPEPAVKGFTWTQKGPYARKVKPWAYLPRTTDPKWREMARRGLTPAEDTDGDGLPDAWEMASFGSLKCGPYDDPDGDGFPNIIEWYRGTDPTKPDLIDPAYKPREFVELPPPRSPWDIRWDIRQKEFWDKQEQTAARFKAMAARPSGPAMTGSASASGTAR